MKPNFVRVCVISSDEIFRSLLCNYLRKEMTYVVSESNITNIPKNNDIYILNTDNKDELDCLTNLNGSLVLITNNFTNDFIYKSIGKGITHLYDTSISLEDLYKLGLHLYIYRKGILSYKRKQYAYYCIKGKHYNKLRTNYKNKIIL